MFPYSAEKLHFTSPYFYKVADPTACIRKMFVDRSTAGGNRAGVSNLGSNVEFAHYVAAAAMWAYIRQCCSLMYQDWCISVAIDTGKHTNPSRWKLLRFDVCCQRRNVRDFIRTQPCTTRTAIMESLWSNLTFTLTLYSAKVITVPHRIIWSW